MMPRTLGRLVAVLALLTQLQWLPGALWCEREHRQPSSHCDDASPAGGAVLLPAQAANDVPCSLADPCVWSAPMAVLGASPTLVASAAELVPPVRAARAPASLDLAPAPPPPQG